jgi:hypothetical protein
MDVDINQALMLDGNAVAGLLQETFNAEMTASPTECASCGNQGDLGSLLAFTQAPGMVLRCPVCKNTILRIVETPRAYYLEARGAAYLCLARGAK